MGVMRAFLCFFLFVALASDNEATFNKGHGTKIRLRITESSFRQVVRKEALMKLIIKGRERYIRKRAVQTQTWTMANKMVIIEDFSKMNSVVFLSLNFGL